MVDADNTSKDIFDIGDFVNYAQDSVIDPSTAKTTVVKTFSFDLDRFAIAHPGIKVSADERSGLAVLQLEIADFCVRRGDEGYTGVLQSIPLPYSELVTSNFPEHLTGYDHVSSIIHNLVPDLEPFSLEQNVMHLNISCQAISYLNSILRGVDDKQQHLDDEEGLYRLIRSPRTTTDNFEVFQELLKRHRGEQLDIGRLHAVFEKGKLY